MCGIAGVITQKESGENGLLVNRMTDAIAHRGPDGHGLWVNDDKRIALGHVRLSIIDLTDGGAQPLHYLHFTLVFNGEIYNYKELRSELISFGYKFHTNSDSEVIPAAYHKWGGDCLHRMDGMFAFVLYDGLENKVFVARDRFGEKPFYYHLERVGLVLQKFWFASEMKALWAAGLPKTTSGFRVLGYYIHGGIDNPHEPDSTFFENIKQLPAGHFIDIDLSIGMVKVRRWYGAENIGPDNHYRPLKEEALGIFSNVFTESIVRRLRSDVDIASSLSGGLDSSSIVAVVKGLQDGGAFKQVFTASFPGFEKDETAFAKQVADGFGLQQHLVAVDEKDWIDNWQALLYHQEEPMQSSSVLTQYMVYKEAKQEGIKVLLDGQGADEVLGGYKRHVVRYLMELSVANRDAFDVFEKERRALQANGFVDGFGRLNILAARLPDIARDALGYKKALLGRYNPDLNKDFLATYQQTNVINKQADFTFRGTLVYDTFVSGLNNLLRYADRNSMAHGVEVRLPFLYHGLVEYIFSLPNHFKIQDGYTKWILRKAMEDKLPESIVWRRGKVGYEPPQQKWMGTKAVVELVMESRRILVEKKILDKRVLKRPVAALGAHEKGNRDWRIVCLAGVC